MEGLKEIEAFILKIKERGETQKERTTYDSRDIVALLLQAETSKHCE